MTFPFLPNTERCRDFRQNTVLESNDLFLHLFFSRTLDVHPSNLLILSFLSTEASPGKAPLTCLPSSTLAPPVCFQAVAWGVFLERQSLLPTALNPKHTDQFSGRAMDHAGHQSRGTSSKQKNVAFSFQNSSLRRASDMEAEGYQTVVILLVLVRVLKSNPSLGAFVTLP